MRAILGSEAVREMIDDLPEAIITAMGCLTFVAAAIMICVGIAG